MVKRYHRHSRFFKGLRVSSRREVEIFIALLGLDPRPIGNNNHFRENIMGLGSQSSIIHESMVNFAHDFFHTIVDKGHITSLFSFIGEVIQTMSEIFNKWVSRIVNRKSI